MLTPSTAFRRWRVALVGTADLARAALNNSNVQEEKVRPPSKHMAAVICVTLLKFLALITPNFVLVWPGCLCLRQNASACNLKRLRSDLRGRASWTFFLGRVERMPHPSAVLHLFTVPRYHSSYLTFISLYWSNKSLLSLELELPFSGLLS